MAKKKKEITCSAEMMDEVSFIRNVSDMLEEDFDLPIEDAKKMSELAIKLYKKNL